MPGPIKSWAEYQKNEFEMRKRTIQGLGGQKTGGKGFSKEGGYTGTPPWRYRMQFFDPKGKRTWVRLVATTAGNPFFLFYSRWAGPTGSKKLVISNSHNGELPVPDLVFHYASETGDNKLFAKGQYAVTTAILEYYHEITVQNKDPKKRPYFKYERCGGKNRFGKPNCQYCISEEGGKADSKKVFGQRRYWAMSAKTRDMLIELASAKLNTCLSCGAGEVLPIKFSCPSCNGVMCDRYEDDVGEEDLDALINHEVECPHCSATVKAVAEMACIKQGPEGDINGCDDPKAFPANTTVFDIEMQVEQDPESYALHVHAVRPVKTHNELSGACLQPMPFTEFLQYMPLKEQAENMGVENPFGPDADEALVEFFKQRNVSAVPSDASSEEADEDSIPWNA